MKRFLEMLDPRGFTFEQWSTFMAERLSTFGVIHGGDEKHWKDWARRMVSIMAVAQANPPQPDAFSHWDVWAQALLNTRVAYNPQ